VTIGASFGRFVGELMRIVLTPMRPEWPVAVGAYPPISARSCSRPRTRSRPLPHQRAARTRNASPAHAHAPAVRYALVGSASFLSGVLRTTISVTVILLEASNNISCVREAPTRSSAPQRLAAVGAEQAQSL
jgi:H+/Cl- antiporter ClcA